MQVIGNDGDADVEVVLQIKQRPHLTIPKHRPAQIQPQPILLLLGSHDSDNLQRGVRRALPLLLESAEDYDR